MVTIDLTKMKEQELMHLLVANDLGAWTELVKRYGKLVYSISFQILRNNNDTEDAVQNTFVNLKIYADKFDQSQQLKPWLARIASIEAIRIYNKKKYINKKESVRMETNNKSQQFQRRDAAEIVEQKEVEEMVKKAIKTLPDNSRVALTMYYAGGMNQSEIADQLGINQVRISMTIKSGLEKIKAYLKKAGVNAAVVLSPNLMQEGIISTVPPQALIQKLIAHLPTEMQLVTASSVSAKIGTQFAVKKGGSIWFWYLLSIPIVSILLYGGFSKKTDPLVMPVIPEVMPVAPKEAIIPRQNVKNFKSVDYNDFTPIYYKWGTMQQDTKPLSWKPGLLQYYGDEPKWSIQKDDKGLILIRRNSYIDGDIDGLFLKETFKQAYHFKGTIQLETKKVFFEFVIKTPLIVSRPVRINSPENEKLVTDNGGTLGIYESDEICVLDFQVFIWPQDNKWKSICVFENKTDSTKNTGTSNLLNFSKQEFSIGFYSKGKAEVHHFEVSPLNSNWNPLLEPYINAIEKDLPKGFLPNPH